MRRFLVAFVFILLSGCVPPEVRDEPVSPPVGAQEIRLASWNVRNFFDVVDDKNKDEVLSQDEFQTKVKELGGVLEVLDGDFVALQEVENFASLKTLNDSLKSPYPQLGLIEGNDIFRGIDVCFLSRIPVKAVYSHRRHRLPQHPDAPKRYGFSRDCLEVQLDTEPPVTILINHLKSARGDAKRSAAKRRVQAAGVTEIAGEVDTQGRAIFIVGDLNGREDEWALEPLFQTFDDAFAAVPKKERVTHRFRGGGSALDHILRDPQAVAISQSPRIWGDIARHTSDHSPISIQMNVGIRMAAGAKTWTEAD